MLKKYIVKRKEKTSLYFKTNTQYLHGQRLLEDSRENIGCALKIWSSSGHQDLKILYLMVLKV